MTTSNTTLTSLWVEDGQTGQMKGIPTPSTPDGASKKMPDDIMDFFRDSGFDAIAKEAGIIEEEVVTIPHTVAQAPPKNKTIKLIAVPVSSKTQFAHQMAATPRAVLMSQATPIVMASTAQPTVFSMAQVEGGRGQNNMPKIIQLITTQSNSNMQHPQSWTVTTNKRQNAVTVDSMDQFLSDSKRRKGTHGGKGLRHFSMKVCEKVQKKGVTSYNEVADELVNEFSDPLNSDMMLGDQSFDQKNIRRRVYDALNVLMAMNIISKEKKEIRWIGLPTNSAQECQNLELEKKKLVERIQVKTQQLNELILQQIAFKNLVERNRIAEDGQGPPGSNSAIQLPFILVNTSKKTVIDCSISNDKYEYLFNFDQTFEIHDDIEVLKRMGMAFGLEKGKCSQADLNKAVRMVPKALQPYVIDMANPNSKSKPVSIKLEPGTSSSSYRQGSIYSTTEESLDDEVAWTIDGNLSRQSSYASRSEQQTPDFSDDDSDS